MTQKEWNKLFRNSDQTYQEIRHMLAGVKLFPAHAGKLVQLIQDAAMVDAPSNPGRKDDVGVDVLLSHTPKYGAGQELFTPRVD